MLHFWKCDRIRNDNFIKIFRHQANEIGGISMQQQRQLEIERRLRDIVREACVCRCCRAGVLRL